MNWARIPVILLFIFRGGIAERRCRYVALDLDPGHGLSSNEGVTWAMDCCKICLANPACNGVVHVSLYKACYFKSNKIPLRADDKGKGITSAIIEDFKDPPLAPGTERSCWDIGSINIDSGHDLVGISAISSYDECCQKCKANPDCKAFVHNSASMCYLKYNTAPLVPEESSKWGTRAGIMQVTKVKVESEDSEQEWPEGGILVRDKAHCIQLCTRGRVAAVCNEWVFHELSPTPACVLYYD